MSRHTTPFPTYLLLLNVAATDVKVRHVGLLHHELNAAVRFGREDVHNSMTVTVQSDGSVGFKLFSIKSAQDPHIVSRPSGGVDDAIVAVDHFVELANDKGYGLNSLELLYQSVESLARDRGD
jgi:hypothetical protein